MAADETKTTASMQRAIAENSQYPGVGGGRVDGHGATAATAMATTMAMAMAAIRGGRRRRPGGGRGG
jgi:hypothetical protein